MGDLPQEVGLDAQSEVSRLASLARRLNEANIGSDGLAVIMNRERAEALAIDLLHNGAAAGLVSASREMGVVHMDPSREEARWRQYIDRGLGWRLVKGAKIFGLRINVE